MDPLPSAGTKCIHTGSQQVWIYQGKMTDGWGDYYLFEQGKATVKVPKANLKHYEVAPGNEPPQEGLGI